MKIFFYCTYTNAKRGFFLTRLKKNGLVPENLSNAEIEDEKFVRDFFLYDNFRVIWKEFPKEKAGIWKPQTKGSVFGVRGLKGEFSNRPGIINFAILADKHEMDQLEMIVTGVLKDLRTFAKKLSDCIFVGGKCGYEVDSEALRNLLQQFSVPKEKDKETDRKYTERDLLRFVVYIGSWERASEYFSPKLLFKICPKQAISEEKFIKQYDLNGIF